MKSQLHRNEKQMLELYSYDYEADNILSDKRVTTDEESIYQSFTDKYAKLLEWHNNSFWSNLPNPRTNSFSKNGNIPVHSIQKQCGETISGDTFLNNTGKQQRVISSNENSFLSKKYFNIWKRAVEAKNEENQGNKKQLGQQTKLDDFMKTLKIRRKSQREQDNGDDRFVRHMHKNDPKSRSSYKNRFAAQKNIIQLQNTKLEEQNKIIQELKLGIMSKDLLKSIENTNTNIRQIFANCSEKIKYKIPLVLSTEPKFSVNSQVAPKIVQQMEQRALSRAQNRQLILERKHLIEEARQKMLQKAIEEKKLLKEEEKKRNLELIEERRRKTMETEKIRYINKQKYMVKINKAVEFNNKLLMRQHFKKLHDTLTESKKKYIQALHYYKNKTCKSYIYRWQYFVDSAYKVKYEMADTHFAYILLTKVIATWQKVHVEHIRNMQVAEDFNDFRLTRSIFINWNRYVCIEYIKDHKRMKIAEGHYKRWLLFHYFYLWSSLKVVNELERTKMLKKVKWRQKVWEVLPDYKPAEII